MGWKHTALSAVRSLGGFRLLDAFYGRGRVTVLAHHRIVDPDTAGFVGFRGNASATPSEFEEQMAWVAEHMLEVARDPHAVRHVYVHHGDDPARFGGKVSGVPRLVGGG